MEILFLELDELPNFIFAKDEQIIFSDIDSKFEYIDVNAKFFTENNLLYINLDKHNLEVHDEIFSVVHEYRHFYQLCQINLMQANKEIKEKKSIIQIWKRNFDNYINFGDNRLL